MTTVPEIRVPADPDMAEEPALTIGELFANKALIQPIIAAAVALVTGITGFVVEDTFVSNLTTLVAGIAVIWTAVSAQLAASRRAMQQARQTREAVVAPATAAAAVEAERRKVSYVTRDEPDVVRQRPGALPSR